MRFVLATALLALLSVCPSNSAPAIKQLVTKWHGQLLPSQPVDTSEPDEEEEGGCFPGCKCIPIYPHTPHEVTLQLIRHLAHLNGDPKVSIKEKPRPAYNRVIKSSFTATVPCHKVSEGDIIHDSDIPRFMVPSYIEIDSDGNQIVKRVTQDDIVRMPLPHPEREPTLEIIPDSELEEEIGLPDEIVDDVKHPTIPPVEKPPRWPPVQKPGTCATPNKASEPEFTIIEDDEDFEDFEDDVPPADKPPRWPPVKKLGTYAIPNKASEPEFTIIEDDEDHEDDDVPDPSETKAPWTFEILDDVTEEDENPLGDLILNDSFTHGPGRPAIPIRPYAATPAGSLVKIGLTMT